jgi:hypothetical protein
LRLALFTLVTALVGAQPASAEISRYLVDTGPLRIRDQFLPGLGYLGFDPVSADVLAPGEWQVDFIYTVSNTFAHSPEVERTLESRTTREPLDLDELRAIRADRSGDGLFYIDGEHSRWALATRRGIGHGLQVELVIPVIHFGGGRLDSTIEGFHDTFSFGQAGRLGVPRDAFTAYVRTGDRETYLNGDQGTALGDAILGVRYDLRQNVPANSFVLALETLVKLPTGDVDGLVSSGSADVGMQLIGAKYFRGSCLHFSVGAAYLGPHRLLGLDAQTIVSGMIAWEFAVGSSTTALIQATVSQSPFREVQSGEIAATSTQLTAGMKHSLGSSVLFFGLTENVANFNNTSDIGLHIGVTRGFGRK